jgi:DNA-binding NarL/FixJ family response regulator
MPSFFVIDPLELRRIGIVSLLKPWAEDRNIKIVPADTAEAVAQPDASSIKLILFVIGAQDMADIEAQNKIARLHAQYTNTPLVLVSEHGQSDKVIAAFKVGARGFIPMSIVPSVAIQALDFIMGGGSFFPPAALAQQTQVGASAKEIGTTQTTLRLQEGGLTVRQLEVLERLRKGESNKLIARHLKLRESTVKVHVRQIMRKLGAANRTQAALSAQQSASQHTRDR